MSKTSTELARHALSGPTMGSRWSALIDVPAGFDPAPLRTALAAAVAEVERQMSTHDASSDLMRLNRAPVGEWVDVPVHLARVLSVGLAIGEASGGAFDVALGDAVAAWGFAGGAADPAGIRTALARPRRPAHEVVALDRDGCRVRRDAPVTLDLSGIAKGYGVDRLAETVRAFGVAHALVAIDGELRAVGTRGDGEPWGVAVERPEVGRRAPHSILALADAAVATSGDYRHFVTVGGRRLSHTMDPRRGGPLGDGPASVTVVAPSCMLADGWATAMTVLGGGAGAALARRLGLSVLFLDRDGEGLVPTAVGPVFAAAEAAAA